jgi:hypothetical protein
MMMADTVYRFYFPLIKYIKAESSEAEDLHSQTQHINHW